jgi:hypothetical protein
MTVGELKKLIASVPDDTVLMVNTHGLECKPAKVFAQMGISPAGMKITYSGWALVVDIEGETHKIEGDRLTYKTDESKHMGERNPDGRFADLP